MSAVDLKRFEEESKEIFLYRSREGRGVVSVHEGLSRDVRGVRGSWNSKGVSAVILSAKVCMVCLSLFAPFALFAVHEIKKECPL